MAIKVQDADENIRILPEISEVGDRIKSSVDLEKDRAILAESELNSAILQESNRAKDSENALSTAIQDEEQRASESESLLNDNIDKEVDRAKKSEAHLENLIELESSSREALDERISDSLYDLGDSFDRYKEQVEDSFTSVNASILSEQTRATQAESDLNQMVVLEKNRAQEAEKALDADIVSVNDKIPPQASKLNQLADKAFVNSSINSAAAFFRGNFDTKADLDAWQENNPLVATNNDYAYIESDETHNNEAWRYLCVRPTDDPGRWEPQFKVNSTPFTAAQLASINSGITEGKITLFSQQISALQDEVDAQKLDSTVYPQVYVEQENNKGLIGVRLYMGSEPYAIPQYDSNANLKTRTAIFDDDCINKQMFDIEKVRVDTLEQDLRDKIDSIDFPIDSELDENSENAVQNKVIATALESVSPKVIYIERKGGFPAADANFYNLTQDQYALIADDFENILIYIYASNKYHIFTPEHKDLVNKLFFFISADYVRRVSSGSYIYDKYTLIARIEARPDGTGYLALSKNADCYLNHDNIFKDAVRFNKNVIIGENDSSSISFTSDKMKIRSFMGRSEYPNPDSSFIHLDLDSYSLYPDINYESIFSHTSFKNDDYGGYSGFNTGFYFNSNQDTGEYDDLGLYLLFYTDKNYGTDPQVLFDMDGDITIAGSYYERDEEGNPVRVYSPNNPPPIQEIDGSNFVSKSGDTMTGPLVIDAPSGSYNEGIRINSDTGWAIISLGADKGTQSGADTQKGFIIGRPAGYEYLVISGHGNESDDANRVRIAKTGEIYEKGQRVFSPNNLPEAVKDYTNGIPTYIDYGASALNVHNISYLAAWDDYRLGAVSISDIYTKKSKDIETGNNNTILGTRHSLGVSGGEFYNCFLVRNFGYRSSSDMTKNVVIGDSINVNGYPFKNNIIIGCDISDSIYGGNSVVLGNSSISSFKCQVGVSVQSDERDKADITDIDTSKALDFITQIEPIRFVKNPRDRYIDQKKKTVLKEVLQKPRYDEEGKELLQEPVYEEHEEIDMDDENNQLLYRYGMCEYDRKAHARGDKKGYRGRVGVKAQQVSTLLQNIFGSDNYANIVNDNLYDLRQEGELIPDNVENQLTVTYENFIPFLIGSIKEQQKQIQELSKKIKEIGG